MIQVALYLLFKNSLFFPTKSSSLRSSPISGLSVGIFCVFNLIQSFCCALGGSAASEHFTHLHRNAISAFLDTTRYSTQRNASQPLLRAAKLRCECSHRATSEISTLGSVVSADFLASFVSRHYFEILRSWKSIVIVLIAWIRNGASMPQKLTYHNFNGFAFLLIITYRNHSKLTQESPLAPCRRH